MFDIYHSRIIIFLYIWAAIKTPQEEFSIDLLTPIPSRKLALQLRKPRERSRGTFVYQSLRGRPAEEHIWYKVMMNRTIAEVPRKRKSREMHPRKPNPTPRKMRESFGGREWELTGIVLGFWTPRESLLSSNLFGTWLSISWECHHPNWRTHICSEGRSHQAAIYFDTFGRLIYSGSRLGHDWIWLFQKQKTPSFGLEGLAGSIEW